MLLECLEIVRLGGGSVIWLYPFWYFKQIMKNWIDHWSLAHPSSQRGEVKGLLAPSGEYEWKTKQEKMAK